MNWSLNHCDLAVLDRSQSSLTYITVAVNCILISIILFANAPRCWFMTLCFVQQTLPVEQSFSDTSAHMAAESKAERHSGCSLVGVIDVCPLKAPPALFICLLLFFQWFSQHCFSLRRCVSRTELEGWGGAQPALSTISEPIDIMAIHKSNLIAPESKMCWFGSLREAELTESLFKLLMRTTDVESCTIKTDDCICQSSEAVP